MKLGKATNHEILIKPTSNQGFIVEVGCKRFCFEGRKNLIAALNKYLSDPAQMEKDLETQDLHDNEAEQREAAQAFHHFRTHHYSFSAVGPNIQNIPRTPEEPETGQAPE